MSENQQKTERRNLNENLRSNREVIRSLKVQQDKKRTTFEKIADFLTESFGSMGFLLLNILWFAAWMLINLGIIPVIEPFDPFPFGLLTTMVSLEAIGLAIIVLISQNRSAKIADLREEVDLQVDMQTEREITKLLRLISAIAEKQGIDISGDKELQAMLEETSVRDIEYALEKQVLGATKDNQDDE